MQGCKRLCVPLPAHEDYSYSQPSDRVVYVTGANARAIRSSLVPSRRRYDTPKCWLKIPCVAGEKWDSVCSNDLFVQKWECTTLGTEDVKVPAGKFTTVKVHSKLVSESRRGEPFPILDISHVAWYAPGVGVVKCEGSDLAPDWVLKSFTP